MPDVPQRRMVKESVGIERRRFIGLCGFNARAAPSSARMNIVFTITIDYNIALWEGETID